MQRAKSVNNYMEEHPKWLKELEQLRDIMTSIPELDETVKWGAPVYTVNGKNVVGLGAFKSYVGLWFFQGALLNDPKRVLVNAQEGKTMAMRQWRFQSLEEMDTSLISQYVKEAVENRKQGKEIKPKKKTGVDVPRLLENTLKDDKDLEEAFSKLSPSKQREFAEYITEAKQETTKRRRLEKIIPMILNGVGLNDQYR